MKNFLLKTVFASMVVILIFAALPMFFFPERRLLSSWDKNVVSYPEYNLKSWLNRIFCDLNNQKIISVYAADMAVNTAVVQEAEGEKDAIAENNRISIDVKDVEMKDIARMFSRVSGLNIVVSDAVKDKVTLKVSNADCQEALNIILKTYNLTSMREGDFLRILPYREVQIEEESVPLQTRVIFLNFAKTDNLKTTLEPMKSSRGSISVDAKTNSLVINDTPANIKKIVEVINKLDKRTPQVLIEAMMLDVKLTDEEQFGINWKIDDENNPDGRSIAQNLRANRVEGIIKYGKSIYKHTELTALIDFWRQNQKAEVLANPKVMTLDGLLANIELVEQVPYVQSTISSDTGAITSTVSFKDVGIKLGVTPTISAEGFIALAIKTEQSFRTGTIEGQPVIDSRKAETNLLVKTGETIVIGGLRKKNKTETLDKIPVLGDLPFVGKVFQRKVNSFTDTELLIFVTPYVVKETQLTPSEERNLRRFDTVRDERKNTLEGIRDKAEPFPLRPLK